MSDTPFPNLRALGVDLTRIPTSIPVRVSVKDYALKPTPFPMNYHHPTCPVEAASPLQLVPLLDSARSKASCCFGFPYLFSGHPDEDIILAALFLEAQLGRPTSVSPSMRDRLAWESDLRRLLSSELHNPRILGLFERPITLLVERYNSLLALPE